MRRIRRFRTGRAGIGAAALLALCAAGCGSTGAPSGTVTNAGSPTSNGANVALQFAKCMRAHGVSNFPDPNSGRIQVTPAISSSPAFQGAQKVCNKYLPNAGQPPATAPGERAKAVAFAKCMRTHGEPNFPDPSLTAPSGPPGPQEAIISLHGMTFVLGSGLSPVSPAFQHAASDCGIRLPGVGKQVAP
jgi:hypothetical protein